MSHGRTGRSGRLYFAMLPFSLRVRRLTQPAMVVLASLLLFTAQAPVPALRIVVIEGENAVNVVQQKSAVAPVVEVRDRNNQPVAGAVVRFGIQGGRAAFGSARTLSVTTNAAGRAVATGLAPTGSGAIQISATATFQGQTAATVTIAQTNVMTAAQAATATSVSGAGGAGGATGAGAGGAAAGAGGTAAGAGAAAGAATGAGAAAGGAGLSVTTIGVIGGAAIGGTFAAKQVTGSGDDDSDDNNGTSYQSRYGGNLQFTFPGSPGCTRTHAVTGTMTLHLVVAADGSINGTADLSQEDVVTASTCGAAGLQVGDRNPFATEGIPVQGNGTQLTFHYASSNTFPPLNGAPGGTRSDDMVFAGTLTSGQVSGSIAHSVSIGPPLTPFGAGSYSVAP